MKLFSHKNWNNFNFFQFSFLVMILLELILCPRTTFYLFTISIFPCRQALLNNMDLFTAADLGIRVCKDVKLVSSACGCNRENSWPVRKRLGWWGGRNVSKWRQGRDLHWDSFSMLVNVGMQRSPAHKCGQQEFFAIPFSLICHSSRRKYLNCAKTER